MNEKEMGGSFVDTQQPSRVFTTITQLQSFCICKYNTQKFFTKLVEDIKDV